MTRSFHHNDAAGILQEALADTIVARMALRGTAPDEYADWEAARNRLKEAAPKEFAAWEELEKPDLRALKYAVAFREAVPETHHWLETIDEIDGPAAATVSAWGTIKDWQSKERKYHSMMRFFPPFPAYVIAAIAVIWLAVEVRDSDEMLQFFYDAGIVAVSWEELRYAAPDAYDNYSRATFDAAYADDAEAESASRAWLAAFNALRTAAPYEFSQYESAALDAAKSANAAGFIPHEYFPDAPDDF